MEYPGDIPIHELLLGNSPDNQWKTSPDVIPGMTTPATQPPLRSRSRSPVLSPRQKSIIKIVKLASELIVYLRLSRLV